jgi:hypothetical protein
MRRPIWECRRPAAGEKRGRRAHARAPPLLLRDHPSARAAPPPRDRLAPALYDYPPAPRRAGGPLPAPALAAHYPRAADCPTLAAQPKNCAIPRGPIPYRCRATAPRLPGGRARHLWRVGPAHSAACTPTHLSPARRARLHRRAQPPPPRRPGARPAAAAPNPGRRARGVAPTPAPASCGVPTPPRPMDPLPSPSNSHGVSEPTLTRRRPPSPLQKMIMPLMMMHSTPHKPPTPLTAHFHTPPPRPAPPRQRGAARGGPRVGARFAP